MRGFGVIRVGEAGWMEHERPQAGPLDAIVRPLMVAPCSSDTHKMHGGSGPVADLILGHEAVGEIVEVGSMVTRFHPGDVVIVPCTTPDWTAPGVQRRGGNNAHDNGTAGSFKFMRQRDGVFAEFFCVNHADANLVLLPEDIPMEAALMTTDMMSTGMYGAEMANIQLGDTVVVIGIGPVGLMAVAGARLLGAGQLIAVGSRPNCAALAREYGATDIVDYRDGDVAGKVLETAGGQVDSVIIAGGDAATMLQALRMVKANGTVSNVNYLDAGDAFHIPTPLVFNGMADITIRGGFCPGGAVRVQKMLNLIRAGRIQPEKMLNYRFEGFEKIPEAFALMDQKPRDLIKPVVSICWDG